ncbi:hypothetical protein [Paludisphaera mucosa]|uniref:Uncharacterized protein n=1 Tax=Paludisphaera mucosa TaxID=3030827 RepID=A0ABT6F5S4_9BACT|nr:hypothetical protein [Paludisphaera mucosa]MDG3002864.1 hypothetical protein [Paludisphaera mucosa]
MPDQNTKPAARRGNKQRPVVLTPKDVAVLDRWTRHRYPGGASATQIFRDLLYNAVASLPGAGEGQNHG